MSRAILVLVAALLAWPNVGYAGLAKVKTDPRCVALVIGNNAYEHVPELRLAVNDATGVGDALTRLGFSVHRLEDADHGVLRHGLRDFAAEAAGADFNVVFFSGHGLQFSGRNFLVPVDANIGRPIDVELGTVPLDLIVRVIEPTRGFGLIILDAQFDSLWFDEEEPIEQGVVDLLLSDNRAIAYATSPGMVVFEGIGPNSPFSTALLAHIEEPGLDIGLMFRKIRDEVLAATDGDQKPYFAGTLPGRGVYLAQPKSAEGEPEAQCGQDWLPHESPIEEPVVTR